ncbi:MAG: FHA domain-containing protein [Gemmatimonas sp.]
MKLSLRYLMTLSLLGAIVSPPVVLAQSETRIADIKLYPQRFLNVQVKVVGQATEVVVSPRVGLATGTFRLLDESDPQGILVRTNSELPIPGRLYTITGIVAQLPENAAQVGLVERSRTGEKSPWLLIVVILSGVAAVVLSWMLVRALRQPTPAPQIPQLAPAQIPAPIPMSNSVQQERTQPYSPPRAVTEPFDVSGATVRVVEGPNRDTEVPIGVAEFLIGRAGGRKNHLSVDDPTVSQAHARIRWDKSNNSFFLVNDSATNKVRLDGGVTELAELKNGSRIQLGAVTLEFRRQAMGGNGGRP